MIASPLAGSDADDDRLVDHLRTVLASDEFAGSERRRSLLEYLVAETLAGRGEELKAYRIGRTALGRPSGFDPQSDPIVRVEIGRLRSTLDRYYRTHPDSPIVISIPRGRYAAEFTVADDWTPASPPPAGGGIHLERFVAGSPRAGEIADGIVEAVAGSVRGWIRDPKAAVIVDPGVDVTELGDSVCRLRGTVRVVGDRVRVAVEASLPDEATPFWSETYDDKILDGDEFGVVDRVSERIAWMLVDDWGALAQRGQRLPDRAAAEPSRISQLSYYRAFEDLHRDGLSIAAGRLDAVAKSPDRDARALAALSDTLTAAWLLSAELSPEVRQHAEDLAAEAVALDPRLVEAHLALGYAHFAASRSNLMHQAFETALNITSPSPNALHCAAFVYALDGRWERAEPMTARAVELNPDLPAYWHLVPCVAAVHRDELDRAYVESLQIGDSIGFAGGALRVGLGVSQGLHVAEDAKKLRELMPEPEVQSVDDTIGRVFHDPVVRQLILDGIEASS